MAQPLTLVVRRDVDELWDGVAGFGIGENGHFSVVFMESIHSIFEERKTPP